MREEEVKKVIEATGKENLIESRIKDLMFWSDVDGILSKESFLKYYEKSILEGDQTTARLNLFTKLGYRTDLRKAPNAGDPEDVM